VHCNNNTEGSMMTSESAHSATPGDWIEARGLPGRSARRGEIVEVLGHGRREHYRVRWDERRESIVYPADGVIVVGRPVPTSPRRR
jgi:Domain of unknown function (DUF1918)